MDIGPTVTLIFHAFGKGFVPLACIPNPQAHLIVYNDSHLVYKASVGQKHMGH